MEKDELDMMQDALARLEERLGQLTPVQGAPPAAAGQPEPQTADWLEKADRDLANMLAGTAQTPEATPEAPTTTGGVADLRAALLEALERARDIVAELRRTQGSDRERRRAELEAEIRRLEGQAVSLRDESARVTQRLDEARHELAALGADLPGGA